MNELRLTDRVLRLWQGDITTIQADAIVNAANPSLLGGGGVNGAIHRAGGPSILAECRQIGGCPTGEARITSAGQLPARFVIHAVGPVWQGGHAAEDQLLASAYTASFRLAEEHGLASIAFPSLSTGAYGFPIDRAARIALRTVFDHLQNARSVNDVLFVLWGDAAFQTYQQALQELAESTTMR